jgi:hypothetical protein
MMIGRELVLAAAIVPVLLGIMHLAYTRLGRLAPRDGKLQEQMVQTPLVLTRRTTMWRAWIGFNATHSLGLIFFGLTYGYFAIADPLRLATSPFLIVLGFAVLAAYVTLSKIYFFRDPLIAVSVALIAYIVGVALLR